MLMKKEVIEDNEKLKEEIKDLKKQLEEEKNAYNRMYNMYVEKDNIINELNDYCFQRYATCKNNEIEQPENVEWHIEWNCFLNILNKIKELKGSDK